MTCRKTGPDETSARGKANTPSDVLARYNNGEWPHAGGDKAPNGNFLENEEIAIRHGICGDPEQVSAQQ